jgi:hypothetical protein
MLAHLNEGELDGRRILSTETARTMQARAFGHDDRLNGFALGFYEKSRPGLRAIGHGGDTQWFHTDLALMPSEDLGVFASYNTVSGGELSFGPFFDAFMDHYYPVESELATPSEADREVAGRIAGEYAFNRRSYTTFQKAMGLSGAVTVRAQEDGALVLKSPLGLSRLVPVGPLLYRDGLGEDLVAFREDADGRVTHGFLGIAPMMALERAPRSEAMMLHRVLLGLALLAFLGTVVAAPRRWWRKRKGTALPGDDLPGRKTLVAMALRPRASGDRDRARPRCGGPGRPPVDEGVGHSGSAAPLQRRGGPRAGIRVVAQRLEPPGMEDVSCGSRGQAPGPQMWKSATVLEPGGLRCSVVHCHFSTTPSSFRSRSSSFRWRVTRPRRSRS